MSVEGTCSNGGTYHYDYSITTVRDGNNTLDKTVINCSANNCEADPASTNINDFMRICLRDIFSFGGFNISSTHTARVSVTKYKLNGSFKKTTASNVKVVSSGVAQRYDLQTKVDNFYLTTIYDNNTSQFLYADGNKTAYINFKDNRNEHKRNNKIGIDAILTVKNYYYTDNYITDGYITDINNKERIVSDINTTNGDYNSTTTDDGYIITYKVSGTEDNKTVVSHSSFSRDKSVAYDALVVSSMRRGDVTTSKVEGGYSLYPNGMVDITTTPLIKHNTTFHTSAGSSILPYAGKFKFVSNNVAEFQFEKDDQNKTSATLKIDGAVVERYNTTTDLPNLIQVR